jgi:hypothetical protein
VSGDAPSIPGGVWIALVSGVGLEFALGVASLVVVPTNRPGGWIPARGEDVYLAHAIIGGLLGFGALLVLLRALREGSLVLLGAAVGAAGLLLGAGGGLLTVSHSGRPAGIALMLAGTFVALFGFLLGLAAQLRDREPQEEGAEPH